MASRAVVHDAGSNRTHGVHAPLREGHAARHDYPDAGPPERERRKGLYRQRAAQAGAGVGTDSSTGGTAMTRQDKMRRRDVLQGAVGPTAQCVPIEKFGSM